MIPASASSFPGITLGKVTIPGPVVILAPLSGVTDLPFRSMVRAYGNPSLVVSEMIASPSMVRHIRKTLRRGVGPKESGLSVQLAGNDPQVMAEAARIAVGQGAALIDLNFGCPAKKIAINSYAGSALMQNEALAGRIFRAVVEAVPVPVTLKMRMGWDQENLNAPALARIAEESGISLITIHGRTRCQFFHNKAHWDFFAKVCAAVRIPVIGNGDIVGPEEAYTVFHTTPVQGVMVGRGCYGKPWLLGQIRHFLSTGERLPPPSLAQQAAIVGEHLESMLEHYGRESGLMMARKHLGWYSKGLATAAAFRTEVFQENCPAKVHQSIKDFYRKAQEAQDNQEECL